MPMGTACVWSPDSAYTVAEAHTRPSARTRVGRSERLAAKRVAALQLPGLAELARRRASLHAADDDASVAEGGRRSARPDWGSCSRQLAGPEKLDPVRLVTQRDLAACPPAEEREHQVVGVGLGVDPDQPGDLDVESDFFPHLSYHAVPRRLAVLQHPAGQVQEIVIAAVGQQHPAVAVRVTGG